MTQQSNTIVKGKHNGLRLDQFLNVVRFPWEGKKPTRPMLQKLIETGKIVVDGKQVRPSYRVKPGERIAISTDLPVTLTKKEILPTIPILFEDEAVLIINKPAGLSMHPVRAGQTGTLSDWILAKYPSLEKIGDDPLRPGIVHRLDKDTSGVVVLAKTKKAFSRLKKLFQVRKIEKTYTALVYGQMKQENGSIEAPLGRVRGGIRRGTALRKRTFSGEMRDALTEYSLHTAYPQYTMLSIKPKTGRTHQIRVHLASIGHPVVGDRLYRFKIHRKDALDPPYQLLHATALSFTLLGKDYALKAPFPTYWKQALKTLDGK